MAIQDNTPVKFYFCTSSAYGSAEKEDNAIYYLTDTHELKVGSETITIKSVQNLTISGTPKNPTDAATVGYVDTAIQDAMYVDTEAVIL